MKNYILAGLTLVLISTVVVPPVKAMPSEGTNPFELVGLAERGYLSGQGIPAGNRLASAYVSGELTAQSLIQAAIRGDRLPADALNDRAYVTAVDNFLQDLAYSNGR